MGRISTSKPRQVKLDDVYKLECDVVWRGETRTLWLTYPEFLHEHIDPNSSDWVLTALLIPAMFSKCDLYLSGSISPILYYYASNDIQKILCIQNTKLSHVDINIEETKTRQKNKTRLTAIGFSAGIDSFSSLSMLDNDPALKPDYLATLNVGAMGQGIKGRAMLKKYSKRLNEFCNKSDYKPLIMDSNIDEFFQGLTFQATHTIRYAAAILSLGSAFSHYYYSSTFDYRAIKANETYDISSADPILLPLFSTEATEFRAIGTNLSRLDKVKLVTTFGLSYKYLDICVNNPVERLRQSIPNCSKCWKCARQLMTLELLGELEKYSQVFNLTRYKQNKEDLVYEHMLNVLTPNRSNDLDVVKFAQVKGVMGGA